MNAATIRVLGLGLVVCAAIVGAKALQSHLIAKGDAQGAGRIQAAWDRDEAARSQATARDNAIKFRNAERTANEDAQREAASTGLAQPSRAQVDAACGKARRAAVHCKENLGYPHRILVVIQPRYLQWGPGL